MSATDAIRSEQVELSVSHSFSQLVVGFQASTSAPTPLAQLQNFQGPVKSTQSKIGAVVPTPSEPSSQLAKKAASIKRHGPSAPKRARLRPAEGKRAAYALDCDADDEKILLARIEPCHAMQTSTQIPMCPSSSNDKVSSKPLEILPTRAISIILRIKANAEIPAATQAQQERNLSLLGLTDDGSDLFDVPKMDSPESYESGLELELDNCASVRR
ncbi:hypothetical protein BU17DRAFT_94428 [Hysterangium stoloniferum]|nr:hypothetical protein BU17DRAFT_94428 [Hysterangium stoloniferum]